MSHDAPYATEAGTQRYAQRFDHLASGHFRQRYGLFMSSVGMGTYLGENTPEVSMAYMQSIQAAVINGCNVLDTAINYRLMQSERDVGQALQALFTSGQARRDELIVCTKGGFIAHDGQPPADPIADLQERFYATGLAEPMDIVGNVHCMTPAYLSQQIGVSLENLGLATIDVYYLHNPETQLNFVSPDEFRRRIRAAFERLEAEAADGRIRFYGVATWDGLLAETTDQDYLPLSLLIDLAREVGGDNHRFRFLQFPYNLRMLASVGESNQVFEQETDGETERLNLPLLAAARQYGMVAIGSAGLLQGQLLGRVPAQLKSVLGQFRTDAQYLLQFNRSTPGLTTTLVGMSTPQHVAENLQVAQVPGIDAETFFGLFHPEQ